VKERSGGRLSLKILGIVRGTPLPLPKRRAVSGENSGS